MLRHAFHLFAIVGAAALISFFSAQDTSAAEIDLETAKKNMITAQGIVLVGKYDVNILSDKISEIKSKMNKEHCKGKIYSFGFSNQNIGKACTDLIAQFTYNLIMLKSAEQSLAEAQSKYNDLKDKYRQTLGQHIAELALNKFFQREAEEKKRAAERKRRAAANRRRAEARRNRTRPPRYGGPPRRVHSVLNSAIAEAARGMKRQQAIARDAPNIMSTGR